jgi:hypothetical protein
MPSIAWSQNGLLVTSVVGKAEVRQASKKSFVPLAQNTQVQVGDEIRTTAGSQVVLTLPDSSYIVVTSDSKVVIRDVWSGGFHDILNLALGRVRFYIQRFGGVENPYRLETPTALVAVKGTIFDVFVDSSQTTEVECSEGRVAVEAKAFPGIERIVFPGWKTIVTPGQEPLTPAPIASLEPSSPNRTITVVKKGPGNSGQDTEMPSLDAFNRNNDRSNRPGDRQSAPSSQTDSNVSRAKSSVTYP